MTNSFLRSILFVVALLVIGSLTALPLASAAQEPGVPRLVLVLTRHGVRSPTHPAELAAYARQPWPTWATAPGNLTTHGALLMRQFGSAYRRMYASMSAFAKAGCPAQNSIFVWADVDERTLATARALLDGLACGCGIEVGHASGESDPLFDPLPSLGKADSALSTASVRGAIGDDPEAIVAANAGAYRTLDKVLGCGTICKLLSEVPTTIDTDADTGLASVGGGLDAAGTAAENLLLAYADGQPHVGWGRADGATILQLMQLHALKSRIEHETYYNARAEGSNMLSHITVTLEQAATGTKNPNTRVPLESQFVAIVGHDTNLSLLAGMLHLSWLMNGYQINDTPPGGALIFELYKPTGAPSFVRLFFIAQSLDQMRAGDGANPNRVPVYIPGCPSLDCPIDTFSAIARTAINAQFVGAW